jgi:hypothetical protein
MKKALALGTVLVVPMALYLVAFVPNIVFLVGVLTSFVLPAFIFEALAVAGGAFIGTMLLGLVFGHNLTTTLFQALIVAL